MSARHRKPYNKHAFKADRLALLGNGPTRGTRREHVAPVTVDPPALMGLEDVSDTLDRTDTTHDTVEAQLAEVRQVLDTPVDLSRLDILDGVGSPFRAAARRDLGQVHA